MKKAYLNWSSGKDAVFAMYSLQQNGDLNITKLVTTLNSDVDRISMHGVRRELLELQARSIGLPLHQIPLAGNVTMNSYNLKMKQEVEILINEGYTHSIFGDIFLEDLKAYREEQLEKAGIIAVFPLWKRDTLQLARDFIDAGFKAITVCVNARLLDDSFCGRIFDHDFINSLPTNIDPCGENGEFHTFVYDGPTFRTPVHFEIGEKVQKSYLPSEDNNDNCFSDKEKSWDTSFWYCDLLSKVAKI